MIIKICEYCGNETEKRPSEIKNSLHTFCNRECYGRWLSEKKINESEGKEVECDFCGNKIYKMKSQLDSYKHQFCNNECKNSFQRLEKNKGVNHPLYNRVEVECSMCGDIMLRVPYDIEKNNRLFCSKKCQSEYQKTIIGEQHPSWKGGLIKVNCSNCGCELERKKCFVDKFDNFFCCADCRGQWISNNLKGDKHPIFSQEEYECDECGKKFLIFKGLVNNGSNHFCSRICSNKYRSDNYTGENSFNWKGGITPFVKSIRLCKEYYEWRTNCFERDNYLCQSCGCSSNKLVVHHKNPLIKIIEDNNLTNMEEAKLCYELWNLDNGVTLCQDCHKLEHPQGFKKWKGGVDYE